MKGTEQENRFSGLSARQMKVVETPTSQVKNNIIFSIAESVSAALAMPLNERRVNIHFSKLIIISYALVNGLRWGMVNNNNKKIYIFSRMHILGFVC